MGSGTESKVQVAPDSTGSKIRTLEVTTYVNGVASVVEMQVVAIADELGNPISLSSAEDKLDRLYLEARFQSEVLLRILNGVDQQQKTTREELLEAIEENDSEQESES